MIVEDPDIKRLEDVLSPLGFNHFTVNESNNTDYVIRLEVNSIRDDDLEKINKALSKIRIDRRKPKILMWEISTTDYGLSVQIWI